MIAFYFILYGLFLFLAALFLPFNWKVRESILGRIGVVKRSRKAAERLKSRPAWVHVASSGEFEQCLPILDKLKEKQADLPIILTYFSPTARQAIELEASRRAHNGQNIPWEQADFAPFDLPWVVRGFIDAIRPKVFVSVHREVWPGILRACRRRQIPRLLVASRFAKTPGWLLSGFLRHFDFIGVIDDKSAQVLSPLSLNRIERLGDSRIERVLQRKLSFGQSWKPYFNTSKTLVLASVWPQDIAELETSIAGFVQSGLGRLVIVPHEPKSEFVLSLEHFIRDHGGEVRRWSVWKESPDHTSHLVVDRVGELAEIYSIATLAFVGGSFKAKVHNVLEPAAYGIPILTGPYIDNSAEAEALSEIGSLIRLESGDELLEYVADLFKDDIRRSDLSTQVTGYLASHRGAHDAYANRILSLN